MTIHRPLDLVRISRFCMQVRSKLGLKLNALDLVKDKAYAAQVFAEIQAHEALDEDLLTACLELVSMLTPDALIAAPSSSSSQISVQNAGQLVSNSIPKTKPSFFKRLFDKKTHKTSSTEGVSFDSVSVQASHLSDGQTRIVADEDTKTKQRDLSFGPRG